MKGYFLWKKDNKKIGLEEKGGKGKELKKIRKVFEG
jgi:hypothetical protein